jgi:hypothetical protein
MAPPTPPISIPPTIIRPLVPDSGGLAPGGLLGWLTGTRTNRGSPGGREPGPAAVPAFEDAFRCAHIYGPRRVRIDRERRDALTVVKTLAHRAPVPAAVRALEDALERADIHGP